MDEFKIPQLKYDSHNNTYKFAEESDFNYEKFFDRTDLQPIDVLGNINQEFLEKSYLEYVTHESDERITEKITKYRTIADKSNSSVDEHVAKDHNNRKASRRRSKFATAANYYEEAQRKKSTMQQVTNFNPYELSMIQLECLELRLKGMRYAAEAKSNSKNDEKIRKKSQWNKGYLNRVNEIKKKNPNFYANFNESHANAAFYANMYDMGMAIINCPLFEGLISQTNSEGYTYLTKDISRMLIAGIRVINISPSNDVMTAQDKENILWNKAWAKTFYDEITANNNKNPNAVDKVLSTRKRMLTDMLEKIANHRLFTPEELAARLDVFNSLQAYVMQYMKFYGVYSQVSTLNEALKYPYIEGKPNRIILGTTIPIDDMILTSLQGFQQKYIFDYINHCNHYSS